MKKRNLKFGYAMLFAASFSIWIAACSHGQKGEYRNPSSSGTDWTDESVMGDLLNFDLGPGEKWGGGSKSAEIKGFIEDSKAVMEAQETLRARNEGKPVRVFHAKQQGCAVGELEVFAPNEKYKKNSFRGGVFAQEGKYPFLARFSNGVGVVQSDGEPDVRGLAFKLFNVKDEDTGEIKTMDINMTNGPTPFGANQAQFIEFMKANIKGNFDFKKGMPGFFAKYPGLIGPVLATTTRYVYSMMTETFWAGHPYLMRGARGPQPVKFAIVPIRDDGYRIDGRGNIEEILKKKFKARYPKSKDRKGKSHLDEAPRMLFSQLDDKPIVPGWTNIDKNYRENTLRENVVENLENRRLGFALLLLEPQLNSAGTDYDQEKTPVENNLVAWDDTYHSEIVGRFMFDKQKQNSELDALCESASFTPGHFVSQHRPMSNLGRGRIFTYKASAAGRGAIKEEVSAEKVKELRKEVRIR